MAVFLPFSSQALTSQTTKNQIQGSAPYLTLDEGRTRLITTSGLLGITLSNGSKYTPSNNTSSSSRPIELPTAGESFADIDMLIPTDTNSVALSALIGPPNNYWGDDDGDFDVTATGSLNLSIVDKNNQAVSRNSVLTTCNSPYKVTLSSTNGTLATRYGFPNRRDFSESSVTYYVIPKVTPVVCFARPNLMYGKRGDNPFSPSFDFAGPSSMWDPANGFLTQKTDQSSYGQNFPTTGLHGLYFDLLITGSSQPLSWSPVSHGGITATMSNSTATSVRVTLTGPFATSSHINSDNPDRISTPSLPQTFELVGRDDQGNPAVKYGFRLKQWFVKGGSEYFHFKPYSNILSWCNSLGYRLPKVKDLTNSSCKNTQNNEPACRDYVSATPSAPGIFYQRRIGSGFITEWGCINNYSGLGSNYDPVWTSDLTFYNRGFIVDTCRGEEYHNFYLGLGLCTYP